MPPTPPPHPQGCRWLFLGQAEGSSATLASSKRLLQCRPARHIKSNKMLLAIPTQRAFTLAPASTLDGSSPLPCTAARGHRRCCSSPIGNVRNARNPAVSGGARCAGTPPGQAMGGGRPPEPTAALLQVSCLLLQNIQPPPEPLRPRGRGMVWRRGKSCPYAQPGRVLGSAGSTHSAAHISCQHRPAQSVSPRRWERGVRRLPPGPRPPGEALRQTAPSLCCCLKQNA